MNYKLSPDYSGLSQALDIIEEKLQRYKLKRKEITKNMLAAEEVMNALLEHSEAAKCMYLSVRRFLDEISIEITVSGKEFDFEKGINLGAKLDTEDIGPETERTIRSLILKSFVDDLKYRHRNGVNTVRISVLKSKKAMLYKTLGAMFLAVIVGVIFKNFAPESLYLHMNDNILAPIKTMFMNALKMVVAPVVFFSIVSCIGQFSDLSEMGKIGGKTIVYYLLTTVFATGVGTAAFYMFQPGAVGSFVLDGATNSVETQTVDISIKDMIVNIVPGNFFKPFIEADMLQLIFLAVLCGVAVGMIGTYSRVLTDLFTACNELFLKITVLIIKLMPVAAFCSILSMILKTGTEALVSIIGIVTVFIVAIVCMMIIYSLLMLLFARLNPIPFFKKYAPTMAQVFSMGSSNASLPVNMEACKKLGVSPKVYSLSLPLGATINMDGTCVYLSVFALSLARICGITIPPAALMSVLISIIVLSVGAPGIPGSGLVCLSVLLAQLNVPIEAVALVMGIDPLIGMMRTMSNCLGDVAISLTVAKQEGILDMNTYKK